jgi:hypothetical protein
VLVDTPINPAKKVPMKAAAAPTMITSHSGIGCRLGTTNRPRKPMMHPIMSMLMMPVTVTLTPFASSGL